MVSRKLYGHMQKKEPDYYSHIIKKNELKMDWFEYKTWTAKFLAENVGNNLTDTDS